MNCASELVCPLNCLAQSCRLRTAQSLSSNYSLFRLPPALPIHTNLHTSVCVYVCIYKRLDEWLEYHIDKQELNAMATDHYGQCCCAVVRWYPNSQPLHPQP